MVRTMLYGDQHCRYVNFEHLTVFRPAYSVRGKCETPVLVMREVLVESLTRTPGVYKV
jgi:hypothetical protein